MKNNKNSIKILGIKISSTPKDGLLHEIEEKLFKKIRFYIVTPNPEIILLANKNKELYESLNQADFSIPDGTGLKLASTKLNTIKGREFFVDLLSIANKKKLKIYLLGSKPEVIKKSLNIIISKYPNIIAIGNSGPMLDDKANPVSEVDTKLQSVVIKEINTFKPDLLFVAFGAPKQEIWINKHKNILNAVGIMAVGGTLDYFSGSVRPVPNLLVNLKLEWLWRLIQEPKRVGRIFNALIVFPYKLALDKLFQ